MSTVTDSVRRRTQNSNRRAQAENPSVRPRAPDRRDTFVRWELRSVMPSSAGTADHPCRECFSRVPDFTGGRHQHRCCGKAIGEKARSDQRGSLWAHRPGVLLGTGAKALPPAPDAAFLLRAAKSAPVPPGFPCVIEHNGRFVRERTYALVFCSY